MKACLVVLLAGCSATAEDYPIAPGGYGSSNGVPGPDAMLDADPNGLSGRVCAMQDLRTFAPCATGGLLGVTVTLGGSTTVTGDDGSFSMIMPTGSNLVWRVSGAPLVPSVVPYSASTLLPAVDIETYNNLLNANGRSLTSGQGSIVARIVQLGQPAVGVTATTDAVFETLYDGANATTWDQDIEGTGARGVAWLTGVPIGAATLEVTPVVGTPTNHVHLVEDLAITFPTIEIP
ncbi:MAG: hypothetical protein WKG01_21535 [Kofleriaceae bacterium]